MILTLKEFQTTGIFPLEKFSQEECVKLDTIFLKNRVTLAELF